VVVLDAAHGGGRGRGLRGSGLMQKYRESRYDPDG
jgi:hypothetical protein